MNIYDILEPCYHADSSSSSSAQVAGKEGRRLGEKEVDGILRLPSSFMELGGSNPRHLPVRARMSGRAWPLKYTSRGAGGAGNAHRVTLWGENENDLTVPCIVSAEQTRGEERIEWGGRV